MILEAVVVGGLLWCGGRWLFLNVFLLRIKIHAAKGAVFILGNSKKNQLNLSCNSLRPR